LKRVSNLWLKEEFALRDVEWQGGYADFSVSESNLEQVKAYIANPGRASSENQFSGRVTRDVAPASD